MNLPVTIDNIRLYGMYGLKRFEFVADTQNGVEGYYPVISRDVLTWMIVIFVAVGIVGYLLGTLNFAIIISRKKFSEDIRDYGSGNAGMTNMARTYGRGVGIATFLLDLLKAVLAVFIGWFLLGEAGGAFAGFCCVLGHAFPVWYGFKGGKGVAVTAATVFCLEPLLGVFLLLIFIAVVAFTKYISLGSIMAVLMYPVLLGNVYGAVHAKRSPFFFVEVICSVLITLLVLFLHRENMRRLLDHTENKFSFKRRGEKKEIDRAEDAEEAGKK